MQNQNTLALAQACLVDNDAGFFGLDDAILGLQIIYYGLEIWKGCHTASNPEASGSHLILQAKTTINANVEGDGQTYSRSLLRRAGRGVHRAGLYKGINLKGDDLTALTTRMLNTVATADDVKLVGCYFESPTASLLLLEEIPE